MPKLPMLSPGNTSRVVTDVFRGYSHNPKIADGEMYDMRNLTSDGYPLLMPRPKRSTIATLAQYPGGLIAKDKLYVVYAGKLAYLDSLGALVDTALTGLTNGSKQLVSFGAYIVIFPDKKYYNTANTSDYGSLEATWHPMSVNVTASACDVDGNGLNETISSSEPASPSNGDYWYDTAHGELKQYDATTGFWLGVATVYVKYTFANKRGEVPALFKAGDGVNLTIGNLSLKNKYLYAVGGDTNTDDFVPAPAARTPSPWRARTSAPAPPAPR